MVLDCPGRICFGNDYNFFTMNWLAQHILNLLFGFLVALLGYFTPIREVVYFMFAAIIFDLFTGMLAARKRGEGLKSVRMWRTIYKLFYSLIIVMLLFGMDKEMGMGFIQLHKIVAWLITGFEVWSILENAATISNLRIFFILKKFMNDKIKEQTGVSINDKKNK